MSAKPCDLAIHVKRGDIADSSFGFNVESERFVSGPDYDVREITSVKPLYDVSPVTYPAYTATESGIRGMGDLVEVRTAWSEWRGESSDDLARDLAALELRMALLD